MDDRMSKILEQHSAPSVIKSYRTLSDLTGFEWGRSIGVEHLSAQI